MSPQRVDPHSYTESTHPFTTHISLSLYFDFPTSTILSSAHLTLNSPHSGPLSLDTRSLSISTVLDNLATKSPIPFTLSPTVDPIRGQQLTVQLANQSEFVVVFATSACSSALQWLAPPQTYNKKLPFVYTQCQAIHARSIFPCQDTPAARIRFSARLNIPIEVHYAPRILLIYRDYYIVLGPEREFLGSLINIYNVVSLSTILIVQNVTSSSYKNVIIRIGYVYKEVLCDCGILCSLLVMGGVFIFA